MRIRSQAYTLILLVFLCSAVGVLVCAAGAVDPEELTDEEVAQLCTSHWYIENNLERRQANVQYLDFLEDLRADVQNAETVTRWGTVIVSGTIGAILTLAPVPEPAHKYSGIALIGIAVSAAAAEQASTTDWISEEIGRVKGDPSLNVKGNVYRPRLYKYFMGDSAWWNPFGQLLGAVGEFFQNATLTWDLFFIKQDTVAYLERVCDEQKERERRWDLIGNGSAGTGSSTVLVIDTSGSMNGPDQTGKVKIEAAKQAAIDIVNMLRSGSLRSSHDVSVVAFTTSARTAVPLTSDFDAAIAEMSTLSADGNTNMHQGIALANEQLENATGKPIIILLSDGVPTEGPGGNYEGRKQAILDGPVEEAAQRGYCIYVVGFGDPSEQNIDQDFLNAIVQAAGCDDESRTVTTALELYATYVEMRYDSMDWYLVKKAIGIVKQGEEQEVGEIVVPPNQRALHTTLVWLVSQLDPVLTDPQNRKVDADYPGATIDIYDYLAYTIVSDPVPGPWKASVFGSDVPSGSTEFAFLASVELAEKRFEAICGEDGIVFTYQLPPDVEWAKVILADTEGGWLSEAVIDPRATRFPVEGFWQPIVFGEPLSEGTYSATLWTENGFFASTEVLVKR